MMKNLIVWIFLMGFYCTCFGQKFLLFHKNNHREAIYKVGDVISFALKSDDSKITDKILGFKNDSIVFENYEVNPNEITHLYVDDKTRPWYIFRYKYKVLFPILGGGYLLLDVVNNGQLKEQTLIISGSLIVAGLLAKWLISEKIKIKGKRKLVIIGY